MHKLSDRQDKHQFIYSMISTEDTQSGKPCFWVHEFKNFTANKTRSHFEKSKLKKIDQENKEA